MKEKILNRASELFLEIGFKSTTMDHIAEDLGISKKTIYTHYPTKIKLVEACALSVFEEISKGIDEIIAQEYQPIEELLNIHQLILNQLRDEKASPQFQLKRYYPKVDEILREKKVERMSTCVINNLKRGVEQGYYRKDIEVELVYRFYFMTLEGLRDSEFYALENFSIPHLLKHFLEYHIRGIASEKGLNYINNSVKKCHS